MKIICSFCNTVISPGRSAEDQVSHGVCKYCYTRILTEYGFNLKKFLNMLEAPVFLVDEDVNIIAANSLALAAVNKPIEETTGHICGDVLECINAFLPEGCGKTPNCPDCTIRTSVNETYKTGTQTNRRPTDIIRKNGESEETARLLVSTRKDGSVVLLTLEFCAGV
ncbi:hypothetical protein [Methanosphaerula palustris]|uniref:PAS domain-containing protein n=1 Tax=Methanosphaerula palustris (strain ATCC BAA-1556 / DSM 19958 / E1-9c) TaxID=521011 RepID=B8GGZ6_METPE|nr:hypothetical protein [Methanosphaerula palustris]ACL16401.1 conserved hypothetical protein [Methanosphaerula palustris E1-9c]